MKHAVWFDFEESADANWSDWELFALRFANISGLDEEKLGLLYEQFREYKSNDDDNLLNEAYEEALLPETSDGQK